MAVQKSKVTRSRLASDELTIPSRDRPYLRIKPPVKFTVVTM